MNDFRISTSRPDRQTSGPSSSGLRARLAALTIRVGERGAGDITLDNVGLARAVSALVFILMIAGFGSLMMSSRSGASSQQAVSIISALRSGATSGFSGMTPAIAAGMGVFSGMKSDGSGNYFMPYSSKSGCGVGVGGTATELTTTFVCMPQNVCSEMVSSLISSFGQDMDTIVINGTGKSPPFDDVSNTVVAAQALCANTDMNGITISVY